MPDVKRRRRKDNLGGLRQNLHTDGMKLDTKQFAYRWVNEENTIARTEEDDYDAVPRAGRPAEGGEKKLLRRQVGTYKDGSPKFAFLARKPRELYEEDRQKHDSAVDETMTSIRRKAAGTTADSPGDDNLYRPSEGVSFKDG